MRKLTDDELNGSASDSSDYSSSSSTSSSPAGTLRMSARAVLTCRPNSHPFQERNVSLEQPVKIGRSVARARPSGNNAIFDCKVLSRNHALVWHENGKFFLQDTKSSNGTFVNNQRLSKSSEESPPREVCSGDIVQFGVDVMEVNKKLTHGCIVANLQLFLPDGKEAKASSSTALPELNSTTSLQEVYQLNQYTREAMQKEQLVENKVAAVKKLVEATKISMSDSWKSLIEEDRLLTRIDILERQIQVSHKNMTDEKLKEEISQLYEDKEKYQKAAKEALQKAMLDKIEISKKYQDIERNMTNSEEEKFLLKEMFERNSEELQELADKFEKSEVKSKELKDEMETSEAKYKEDLESLTKKLKEEEDHLIDKQKVIDALVAKMDYHIARGILAAYNDDTRLKLPENDSNKLEENVNVQLEEDKAPQNMSFIETIIHQTTEFEVLKSQLALAQNEKKEIQSRFIYLLNYFEDLKAVSNKVQVSEYFSEIMGKIDVEIHQMKNFIKIDETLKNDYTINDDKEVNVDNHVNRRNSDDGTSLEKLLEESREMIKALQTENTAAKRQSENLQEKFSTCAIDLENYKRQVDAMSDANSQLQSKINYLQEKLTLSDQNTDESRTRLEAHAETIQANGRLIETLKGEVSALTGLITERDEKFSQISSKLNDLKVVNPEREVLEVACQTVEGILSSHKALLSESSFTLRSNGAAFGDSSVTDCTLGEQTMSSLKEKVLQMEEELAVYKDRYNECSADNVNLNRKVSEFMTNQEASAESRLVFYCCSLPFIILFIAVVVAFYPSISILTATQE